MLLIVVEVGHSHVGIDFLSKSGKRKNRELKILPWSINYDAREGSYSRGRTRVGYHHILCEAHNIILECQGWNEVDNHLSIEIYFVKGR